LQIAVKDFNADGTRKNFGDLPLMSFKKGELIVMTRLANGAQWFEGYVINRKTIALGLCHASFCLELNIRKAKFVG
jgi:hypothetical protein